MILPLKNLEQVWLNGSTCIKKKYAVLNSDGIICISENTKKDLVAFVPNVDRSKIKVIYNGVSREFYPIHTDFTISAQSSDFEALQDYKYLLYIGHRTSYKNFPLAVKAAAQFKGEFKLVIIGEPLNKGEEKMLDDLLKVKESYFVFSRLDNVKLNLLYNKAFALLYPSSYEGFGIPLLEAMKTHCPVIASNNSSIPEVAGNGAVLLDQIDEFKIASAIQQLKNIEFRNKLIKRGIEQSAKFDWDLTFQQYLNFYKELYYER
ncbi:glycosyltransferase family 4 protein [Flavobacterium oreochromis]|uniref:glycosyltransferase family 4 protein n=1 Tax=Flavobacterium oreochromis TaxID=2906078 RepID=UPI001CE71098|nr:glycosyltransferase family 1 protein [Flavobacterium oreochromis]QYS86608.1 glycosyltransferase family 4 protein [Flavobacterium oreochromis]